MRLLTRLSAPALLCAASLAAHANATTYFNITGPEGTFSFSLPTSPVAPYTYNDGTSAYSESLVTTATYNGQADNSSYAIVESYPGGNLLEIASTSTSNFYYAQLPSFFTGSADHPTFLPGVYTASFSEAYANGSYPYTYNTDQITISNTSPVPEPSTLALLGTGILGLACIGRRLLPPSSHHLPVRS